MTTKFVDDTSACLSTTKFSRGQIYLQDDLTQLPSYIYPTPGSDRTAALSSDSPYREIQTPVLASRYVDRDRWVKNAAGEASDLKCLGSDLDATANHNSMRSCSAASTLTCTNAIHIRNIAEVIFAAGNLTSSTHDALSDKSLSWRVFANNRCLTESRNSGLSGKNER